MKRAPTTNRYELAWILSRIAIPSLLLTAVLVTGCARVDGGAGVADGAQVFRDQGCYGCHTVGTTGTPIATDLTRIGSRHGRTYFVRWLQDPSH
ncbi:MAG TPA: c-type cytochrome, partial [Methylomirabilota bacterium]